MNLWEIERIFEKYDLLEYEKMEQANLVCRVSDVFKWFTAELLRLRSRVKYWKKEYGREFDTVERFLDREMNLIVSMTERISEKEQRIAELEEKNRLLNKACEKYKIACVGYQEHVEKQDGKIGELKVGNDFLNTENLAQREQINELKEQVKEWRTDYERVRDGCIMKEKKVREFESLYTRIKEDQTELKERIKDLENEAKELQYTQCKHTTCPDREADEDE